jgi:hypothetical protein
MHLLFHQRVIAGQDAITHALEQVVCIVSGTLDQIRKHELRILLLIDLDERARRTEAGARQSVCPQAYTELHER